jgi:hypothetical protein
MIQPTRIVRVCVVALTLTACGPAETHPTTGGNDPLQGDNAGGSGHLGGGSGGAGGGGIDPQNGCSAEAMLVYTVDSNDTLSAFHPDTLQFVDIGQLNCPALGSCESAFGPGPATPFSMAIDRTATAWVLYCSGELFKVDTRTAACASTSFQPGQDSLWVFGMGFATDAPMSRSETLYVSGGGQTSVGTGPAGFGTVSFPALAVTRKGQTTGWPELTGTGDAKLWAFYPDAAPPLVAQVDKSSGSALSSLEFPQLEGMPTSWAFAFWGGDFWIFLKRGTDPSTSVYKVHGQDGSFSTALYDTGRTIVGAGVSTCAPIVVGVHR